jgi:syntaxin 8
MENTLKNPTAHSRSQLMGAGLPEASNGQIEPISSPDELKQMTKQLKLEQDKGLDVLDEIITRQKGLVAGIGNQIDVQNQLIDDIGDNMDSTHVKLVRTTRNVERVSRKSNSCCYWVIIVLLLIAIVVVASL